MKAILELRVSPVGQADKVIGFARAVCYRCHHYRWVTADGRFSVHNDDNGHWCNGSREAVRT